MIKLDPYHYHIESKRRERYTGWCRSCGFNGDILLLTDPPRIRCMLTQRLHWLDEECDCPAAVDTYDYTQHYERR
jgi:hypothetical protein